MSRTPLSLLILKRLSPASPTPRPYSLFAGRRYSSASPSAPSPEPPKPSNLSARLSFVFDQIDAIEKERERSQKDETLQRIRAWREAKSGHVSRGAEAEELGGASSLNGDGKDESSREEAGSPESGVSGLRGGESVKEVELVHPWREWIELMERLVQQNYFDHRRKDEDRMVQESGFEVEDIPEERFDGNADLKTVQTACLNFGKDRFDILRSLSRQDIQILVGYGCPSADKKVVMAAKLLRKHVHLDEGDVCSSCNLRSSCEKAYLLTNKEDEARTIDVVRVLSTFGLDHAHGLVANKPLLKQKSVKIVVRKLLHQIVKLSAVPIDPNLPPPVIKRPPPKVKQPPPTPKRRVGRDDVEMKKGDWLCPKCDFMNFAKNSVCLQCDAKRPKRQLLPGEWECPECNFLNYRRNTACFHCDCKRPPDQFMEDKLQERSQNPRTRLERTASRPEVSNAWNFDFDDDESDGADVAAFEYADSSMKGEDSSLHSQEQRRNHQGFEDDFHRNNKLPRVGNREYSDSDHGSRTGFNDFDDEEDDVDSYELDTRNNPLARNGSSIDFSEFEGDSGSEDGNLGDKSLAREKARSLSPNRPLKPLHRGRSVPGSYDDEVDFDSEDETSVRPNWRSSHVADSRNRGKSRSPPGKFRGLSYGSDEEAGLYSDSADDSDEDLGMRRSKAGKFSDKVGRQRNSRLSGLESDDYISSSRTMFGREGTEPNRRGSKFDGHSSRSNRNNFSDNDFDGPSRGERGGIKSRGPRADEFSGRRNDQRSDGSRNYKSPRAGKFENNQRGRFNKYNDDRGGGDSDDDFDGPSRGARGGIKTRGPRADEFSGRRNDQRSDGSRNYKSPRAGKFENNQRGRFNKYNDDRGGGDSDDDFDGPSRGARGGIKTRGPRADEFSGRRNDRRSDGSRNYKSPRAGKFENNQRGRFNKYNDDRGDGNSGDFRNRRRVIER